MALRRTVAVAAILVVLSIVAFVAWASHQRDKVLRSWEHACESAFAAIETYLRSGHAQSPLPDDLAFELIKADLLQAGDAGSLGWHNIRVVASEKRVAMVYIDPAVFQGRKSYVVFDTGGAWIKGDTMHDLLDYSQHISFSMQP
jgi:hypothetical protein